MADKVPDIVTSCAEPSEAAAKSEPSTAAPPPVVVASSLAPEGDKKRSVSPAAANLIIDGNKSHRTPSPARALPNQKSVSPAKSNDGSRVSASPAGGASTDKKGDSITGSPAAKKAEVAPVEQKSEPAKSGKTEVSAAVNGEPPTGASVSGSDVPVSSQSAEAVTKEDDHKKEAEGVESVEKSNVRGRGARGRGGRGRGRGNAKVAAPRPAKSDQLPKQEKSSTKRVSTNIAAKEAAELVGDVDSMPRLRSASKPASKPEPTKAVKRTAQEVKDAPKKAPPAKRGRK